jgi:hypothetical protein
MNYRKFQIKDYETPISRITDCRVWLGNLTPL